MSAAVHSGRSQWGTPVAGPLLSLAFIAAVTSDLRRKVSLIGVIVFISLSVADLTLTRLLLENSEFMVYEANPVADWILQNHGWRGLTVFKLTTVLFVSSIILYIGYFRPATAQRLLAFACMLMGAVVVYSSYLASQYV
jgi:hypothetical protein